VAADRKPATKAASYHRDKQKFVHCDLCAHPITTNSRPRCKWPHGAQREHLHHEGTHGRNNMGMRWVCLRLGVVRYKIQRAAAN